MQAKLPYAAANGLCVAHMAAGKALQPIINPNPGFSITKPAKPVSKDWRLNDRDLFIVMPIHVSPPRCEVNESAMSHDPSGSTSATRHSQEANLVDVSFI